jgi:hypothetical protein
VSLEANFHLTKPLKETTAQLNSRTVCPESQRSSRHTQTSNPQKLLDNKCLFFEATTSCCNLLYGNRWLIHMLTLQKYCEEWKGKMCLIRLCMLINSNMFSREHNERQSAMLAPPPSPPKGEQWHLLYCENVLKTVMYYAIIIHAVM